MGDVRVLRGFVLGFMAEIYPERAEEQALVSINFDYYQYKQVMQTLNYLTDKGYLERTERKHPTRLCEKLKFYRATPEGMDVAGGVAIDKGVFIEEVL